MTDSFIWIVTPWTSWVIAGINLVIGFYIGYLVQKYIWR